RPDRLRDGSNRQERQGAVEPFADAFQAITLAHPDRSTQSARRRGRAAASASLVPESAAEDLLRHSGRDPAAHDRAGLQRTQGVFPFLPPISARNLPRPADVWRSADQTLSEEPLKQ